MSNMNCNYKEDCKRIDSAFPVTYDLIRMCPLSGSDRGRKMVCFKKSARHGFMTSGRVCNDLRYPFSDVHPLPNHVVNGLRMGTKATTSCPALKYRKIGAR